MANQICNIALGRVAEFYNRVQTNDPANSALIIVAVQTTGLESDAVLKDKLALDEFFTGTTNEAVNTGYARKVLTDVGLSALSADLANDRMDVDIPDQTWTAVAATGGAWSKILICYDSDTTAGTDANIIPLTMHDFVVTPDGNDITMQVAATGFYRAT